MRLSLVFALLGAALCSSVRCSSDQHSEYLHYDGYHLLRATPDSIGQLFALYNFSRVQGEHGIQFWQFNPKLGEPTDIFVPPTELERVHEFLANNAIECSTLVADFGDRLREARGNVSDEPELLEKAEDFDHGKYHTYDAIMQYLRLLAQAHPQFVQMGSIGKTFEGRDMPILTLGYPAKNGAKKPALLLDAGIHAREWIAPATALHFLNALIQDRKFHKILDQIDVFLVPVLNPDGYVHAWNKNRLWRRTRSGPKKADKSMGCSSWEIDGQEEYCYGADPNRNFPFHWDEAGTSRCPCSQVYSGDHPLSEPECANLAEFVRSHNDSIKAYLTLHAYGNLLIHGYGFQHNHYPKHVSELRSVANAMNAAITEAGGPKFKVGSAPDILYLVSGSSDDFVHSQGVKFAFTMELTNGFYEDNYYGFVYPEKGINSVAKYVLPAIHVLADQVRLMGTTE